MDKSVLVRGIAAMMPVLRVSSGVSSGVWYDAHARGVVSHLARPYLDFFHRWGYETSLKGHMD